MIPALISLYTSGGFSGSGSTDYSSWGSSNVKGSYVQLIASTTYDTVGFFLFITGTGGGTKTCLFDVAIGAASSEQIIAPDILWSNHSWNENGALIWIPVRIPAGSRIAVRGQRNGSGDCDIGILLMGPKGGFPFVARLDAYGSDTSDSGGTSVDPGASAGTKGAYSQLASSTTYDVAGLVVCCGPIGDFNSSREWNIDIAVGAASSEQIILPNLHTSMNNDQRANAPQWMGPFFIAIPSGSRIAARAACNSTTSSQRIIDVAVYGLRVA